MININNKKIIKMRKGKMKWSHPLTSPGKKKKLILISFMVSLQINLFS